MRLAMLRVHITERLKIELPVSQHSYLVIVSPIYKLTAANVRE